MKLPAGKLVPKPKPEVGTKSTVSGGSHRYSYFLPRNDNHDFDRYVGVPNLKVLSEARRSAITTCEECPRKGLLSYVYGLRLAKRPQGMDQSSYGHMTIALLLRGVPLNGVIELIDKVMGNVAVDSGDPSSKERAQDACLGFATGCYLYDKLVTYIKRKGFEIYNVEEKFDEYMRVTDPNTGETISCPYRFQTDFVIYDPKEKCYYLWDSKLIATATDKYAAAQSMYLQGALYFLWASNPAIYGDKVKGFIFGICQKPSCSRKGMTRGEEQTLEDYVKETYENLEGKGRWSKLAEKRSLEPALTVTGIRPTRMQLDMVAKRMAEHMRRMAMPRNHINFPTHDSCLKGYMTCEFFSLCQSEPRMWKTVLSGPSPLYTTRADPLDSEVLSASSFKKTGTIKSVVHRINVLKDYVELTGRSKMSPKWIEGAVLLDF